MIHLITVESGSSGNCYIVESVNDAGLKDRLIIEAGVPFKRTQAALKFDLRGISGCIVSHEHGDHAGFVKEYIQKGIKVYATAGTCDALGLAGNRLKKKCTYHIGGFLVMPFDTEHDAAEPCGFLVDCPDGNRIVFATDTYYLKYKFSNVTVFMLECNYDEKLLKQNISTGIVHASVGERVRQSHMSIIQCIETLKANDLSKTKAILLIHLSKDNSKSEDFKLRVGKATGKAVYLSSKGARQTIF